MVRGTWSELVGTACMSRSMVTSGIIIRTPPMLELWTARLSTLLGLQGRA